ncbi:class I SAM-dependent methyltransferase [Massilia sp. X63]|uniref:class I SAM-dependent methyltransferase n=1 Tax=Massilia sp. X63 TaxID=3237285 RepID=UPI0034DD588D
MSSTTTGAVGCPICGAAMARATNPFCDMQAQLLHPGASVQQHVCPACGHGWLQHDVPLALLYNSNVALPTEYVNGDMRFPFVARQLDLSSISGQVVEFGGGPGELAEQARRATGKARATVVDFVDRVAAASLDFVALDFNADAARIPELFDARADRKNLFLLSHVIEHLLDPAVLLRELGKFQDSVIFIEVPDFGSRHAPSTLRFSLNHLEHLHYFTSRSLLKLLQDVGFEILAFETQAAPSMPALRALCTPRPAGHNAVLDYREHFADVVGRLKQKILDAGPERQVWVWGLSAFMAQALADLGDARGRVAGIFDTRFPQPDFMGIPVRREPGAAPSADGAARTLVVCGSTYSAVQKVIKAKAEQLLPGAEFFAIAG